jgi:hypothetical protein
MEKNQESQGRIVQSLATKLSQTKVQCGTVLADARNAIKLTNNMATKLLKHLGIMDIGIGQSAKKTVPRPNSSKHK